jgi:hypothetical protein
MHGPLIRLREVRLTGYKAVAAPGALGGEGGTGGEDDGDGHLFHQLHVSFLIARGSEY